MAAVTETYSEVVARMRPELAALWSALEEGAALAARDYADKEWDREKHPHHFSNTVRAGALELELFERAELGHFRLGDGGFDSIELIHHDGTKILCLATTTGGGLPPAKTAARRKWYEANADAAGQLSLLEERDASGRLRHIILTYRIEPDGTFTAELSAPSGSNGTYWSAYLRLEDLLDALPPLIAAEAPIEDARDLDIVEEEAG